jgi:deoxyadenosine/deoxycytidine kinase
MNYFISIAGNIGAGKSSLTYLLAEKLRWKCLLEPWQENLYITDFYNDMYRWSFHSQVSFLHLQSRQNLELLRNDNSLIQERSIYESRDIFARNLYQQGYMTKRDWDLYCNLYEMLTVLLPTPNLIIYLKASVPTLMKRIIQRGLHFDQTISSEYLSQLNLLYEKWASEFQLCPILTIDSDDFDFVHNEDHFDKITTMIVKRINNIS